MFARVGIGHVTASGSVMTTMAGSLRTACLVVAFLMLAVPMLSRVDPCISVTMSILNFTGQAYAAVAPQTIMTTNGGDGAAAYTGASSASENITTCLLGYWRLKR
jgi:hypothetical protein